LKAIKTFYKFSVKEKRQIDDRSSVRAIFFTTSYVAASFVEVVNIWQETLILFYHKDIGNGDLGIETNAVKNAANPI